MKYLSAIFILSSVLIVTSCGSNSDKDTVYTPSASDSTKITTTDTTINPASGIPELQNTNAISTPVVNTNTQPLVITPQPSAAVPTVPSSGGAGLNPEHGKPGHRCDIAVGAPLNSAPTPQPTAAVTNTPSVAQKPTSIVATPQPSPAAATTSKTIAPGMNPEHGKPGHRCDIAVGAPLDSKPIEAKVEQKTEEVKTNPVTPVLPAANPDGAALNPEHGKPGHRCDIAVGAPLPKQ